MQTFFVEREIWYQNIQYKIYLKGKIFLARFKLKIRWIITLGQKVEFQEPLQNKIQLGNNRTPNAYINTQLCMLAE